MKLKDLELGIVSYCEQKVAPMLTSSLDRWLLFAGLAVYGTKLEKIFSSFASAAENAGLMDADGSIDLDLLERIGTEAFRKQDKIQLWKLTFTVEDFKDFLHHVRGRISL